MANERRIVELVLKAVGDADLKAMTRDLVSMRKAAEQSQHSLSGIEGAMSHLGDMAKKALSFAAVEEGLRRTVEVVIEATTHMAELAAQIHVVGVQAQEFQALQFGAKLSEVDPEALNKGLIKLSVNMADLANKGTAATRELRALGITAKTDTLQAMEKVADQFAKMPDGAEKTALAFQLFGRAGAELIPLLNKGAKGLADYATEAKDLGAILSNEALAGAEQFHQQLVKLETVVTANTEAFVGGMAPALATIAGEFLGATKGGKSMEEQGRATGAAMIALAADVAEAISTVKGYTSVIVGDLSAVGQALLAVQKLRQGDLGAGVAAFERAQKLFNDDTNTWNNIEKNAHAAKAAVLKDYQDTLAETKRLAEEIGKPPKPGDFTEPGKPGKGDKGAAAARAAERKAAAEAAKEAKAQAKELADAQKEVADTFSKSSDAADDYFKSLGDYVDGLERAVDPTIAYAEGIERLNKAWNLGKLSAAGYAGEVARLKKVQQDAIDALPAHEEAQKRIDQMNEEHQKAIDATREKYQFLGDAVGRATEDIISGSMKAGQAVKLMIATIIAEFVRLALVSLANKFIAPLLGGGMTFSAKGDVFAAGGVVNSPTMFAHGGGIGIMGEAGPEAILPLQRDASGKLGVSAPGGGLSVVVNNYAGAAVRTSVTDQGLQIDVVERVLADRVRRGGTPLPRAMENTYRNGRQASAY